ncbi:hypothetical protein M2368_003078 [Arthrobacter sp. JUb119]|nr:hypothetical protein [Arthrobacter sp. JUb119]
MNENIASNEAHLLEIGRISTNFNTLESLLAFLIWGLIGVDQRIGTQITATLSFNSLLDLFSRLTLIYAEDTNQPDLAQDLKTLKSKITQSATARNEVLHSMWIDTGSNGAVDLMRIKFGKKNSNFQSSSTEQLRIIAAEIGRSTGALMGLAGRIPKIGVDGLEYPDIRATPNS